MASPVSATPLPEAPSAPSRRRSIVVRLVLVWTIALAALGIYWHQLLGLHAETRAQAEQEIRSHTLETAHTLALEVDRLFRQMDFLTQRLAFDWGTQEPDAFLKNVAFAQEALASASGTTFDVHITDASGQLVFSSVLQEPFSPPDDMSASDREYFWRQREQGNGDLWMGPPLTGRVTGQSTIPASRALYDEGGEFSGVIMISLSARELSASLDEIFPDARDIAAIVLDNGSLLARTQGDARRTDDDTLSALARALVERSPWGSEAAQARGVNDIARLYAWYRTPSPYPIAVLIGRDQAAAMQATDALIASSLRDGAVGSLALTIALLLATWFIFRDHRQYQQLQRLRERQQLALFGGGLGAWDYDVTNDVVTCDELCLQQLGLESAQAPRTRADWLARVHPDDRAALEARMLEQTAEDGLPQRREVRLLHASAQWHWFAVLGKVVQADANGNPKRLAGTLRDITEIVRRQQLQRVLLDESQSAIVLLSAGREVLEFNQRAREIFGQQDASQTLPPVRHFHVNEASFDRMQQHYEVLRERHHVRLTWPLLDGEGQRRWFDMHGVLRDPTDPESDVVWTLNDITEMYLATTALARERQRLSTLLERYPGGVIVEDEDATVALVNARLGHLFGVDHDPRQLQGLSHEALCQTLGEPYATWLLPEPTSGDTTPTEARREREVVTPAGRFLQIERVPVTAEHEHLGRVWLFHDITERKRRERRLARLANTDDLTGLPNRRSFMDQLRLASDSSDWSAERPGAVVMIDVDHFKHINDTYGHATGDAVLQHLAHQLTERLRRGDIAARLGGEEFAILLPRIHPDDAEALADRLRATIAAQPFERDGEALRYTISLGVAAIEPANPDATLNRADKALYEAKRAGRNRVRRLTS